jgi:hypothetical protein
MHEKQAFEQDLRLARRLWGRLEKPLIDSLLALLKCHHLAVAAGDVLLINRKWYITHSALLRVARRKRCKGMRITPIQELSDQAASRFAFRARVFTTPTCKGFDGYGDADPSNVSPLVRGAEMRVAETRAVNRALRKAYGIGICSVEEIGSAAVPMEKRPPQHAPENGNGNGTAGKVRDRLCQLIRQHKLDAELVKAYAMDYCGTKTLSAASREQVESFVRQLAEWAEKDRNALLCQLNSYLPPKQEERTA